MGGHEIEIRLRAVGTPERAANERRYLKSDIEHLGVTLPDNRRIVTAFARSHPDLGHDQLLETVATLWKTVIFDCRMAATLLLERCEGLLLPQDLPSIEALIRDSHTWALVDPLAANIIGGLILRVAGCAPQIDAWVSDPDFWIRRAALLSNLRPRSFDRFTRYAEPMLEEHEFFIRKAIGWVLREQGKRDPEAVYAWLRPRVGRTSGVTLREAVKYLEPGQREELLKARAGPTGT